ncbi:MAG: tripartite tricarboxylate transporter TctB family protein [Methylobacterium mesophilicum]|nr:tripartite tricarboxylate transporter TctB family protein [Methylobacterium mesophilicum]
MNTENPRNDRRPDRAAFVIALILAAFAAVIFWSTSRMPGGGAFSRIGPATFPYAIATVLLVLAVLTVISGLRGDFPEREPEAIGPVVWIIGGLALQMLLLKPAGFSIATGMLFAATARAFGRGPLWLTVPLGIVLSFLIWFVFARGLQLTLPAGPLERLV